MKSGGGLTPEQTEAIAEIHNKANKADVYTKAEADGKFISEHQDISGLATKTELATTDEKVTQVGLKVGELDGRVTELEEHGGGTSVEVVDNLTTDDGTKALSARQGKILNDQQANLREVATKAENAVAQVDMQLAVTRNLVTEVKNIGGFANIGEFKADKKYELNDIVTKDGLLYRFLKAHQGAWDSDVVVQTSLAELVQGMIVGSMEECKIYLSAETSVAWENYGVIVENVSAGEVNTYMLNRYGEVSVYIPKGDVYKVSFPVVDGFVQPGDRQFIATNAERVIRIAYSKAEDKFEQVNIHATVQSFEGADYSILNGKLFYAQNDLNEVIATGVMYDGLVQFNIAYGVHYRITMPDVEGYTHNHLNEMHTAGVVSRDILVTYSETGYGVYALDADGKPYTIEQVRNLPDKNIIVAIAYNDSFLNSADRGDGTTGCGFCWPVNAPTFSSMWCSQQVQFDINRLPFIISDAMGLPVVQGKKNTELIMEIASEMAVTVPAATQCNESILTLGGVDRNGFLPAYGQLRRLALNQSFIDEMYEALGKTRLNFTSGYYWTSCQFS